MSDITINYKGSAISTMDASGTKTLLTEGRYCEDDIEVVYVKPGGGGSANLIASGTYTGDGNSACTVPLGKKMPKTNFVFRLYATGGTEFAYDAVYKFAELTCVITDTVASYDLSSDGTKTPTYTGNITWDVNNGGTITAVTQYSTGYGKYIRNGTQGAITQSQSGRPSIIKDQTGFSLYYSQGNSNYQFVSGMTYNWKLYYFGDSPSTDIVEVA